MSNNKFPPEKLDYPFTGDLGVIDTLDDPYAISLIELAEQEGAKIVPNWIGNRISYTLEGLPVNRFQSKANAAYAYLVYKGVINP